MEARSREATEGHRQKPEVHRHAPETRDAPDVFVRAEADDKQRKLSRRSIQVGDFRTQ